MRPFVLAVAPLFMASATFAHFPLRRGQTTDICAILDADLVFDDVDGELAPPYSDAFQFDPGKPYIAGHIDIGLCISQVQTFVGHYNVTEAAAKVVGVDKVESALKDMIKQQGVQCSYPPHAKPSVTSRNECSFVCVDGFMAMPPNHPSSCICPPNMMECNGICGSPQLDCSTKAPASRRQTDPKCAEGLTMCGVPDAAWGQAYKCTDVTSDSFTCGGCVKASPFGSPSTDGVDCHNLAHVDQVSCEDGRCVVQTCKTGFKLLASENACVAVHGQTPRALPALGAHHVSSVGEKNVNARGSVPGADAALGSARQALSADGKVVP